MRSSDSANRPSQATSVRIRCRVGISQIEAKAAAQNRYSSGCQRARAVTLSVARASKEVVMVLPSSLRRPAREQALRPPDQHHDHDGVNDEGAEFGHVIFAGDVADA